MIPHTLQADDQVIFDANYRSSHGIGQLGQPRWPHHRFQTGHTTDWDQNQIPNETSGLEDGEIIDIGASLSIPEIVKTLGMMGRISSFMPILKNLGGIQGDDGAPLIDPQELTTVNERLPILEQTAAAMQEAGIPVLASLTGDQRIKIFVRLKSAHIQVEDLQDIAGNVRIVGTIESKVGRGRPMEMPILPGLPTQSRAERRRSGSSNQNSIPLRYPAAVVTPIGIFR